MSENDRETKPEQDSEGTSSSDSKTNKLPRSVSDWNVPSHRDHALKKFHIDLVEEDSLDSCLRRVYSLKDGTVQPDLNQLTDFVDRMVEVEITDDELFQLENFDHRCLNAVREKVRRCEDKINADNCNPELRMKVLGFLEELKLFLSMHRLAMLGEAGYVSLFQSLAALVHLQFKDGKGIDREPAFIDEETQMIRMFDSEPHLRAFVPLGGDTWGDREPAVLAVAQVQLMVLKLTAKHFRWEKASSRIRSWLAISPPYNILCRGDRRSLLDGMAMLASYGM